MCLLEGPDETGELVLDGVAHEDGAEIAAAGQLDHDPAAHLVVGEEAADGAHIRAVGLQAAARLQAVRELALLVGPGEHNFQLALQRTAPGLSFVFSLQYMNGQEP